ncbi:tRNA 2-selenouridine(34) synthase MnmH [Donghicola sp. C2-DW-16]|uniref:tRNA 2-selenouridine(34) synthase MnmH n=1 Tax=Donghicola mangrovi TaxID=2729614 RepID=A0ABX2P9S0_9RHOB|nr:tRNA 2-selenouridine(34) synthase MnmH [Donghicola mangrovi]NVO26217.1 tRNA 2-selenouridine(34) synthase MnmH [Donghicola mangrovi]
MKLTLNALTDLRDLPFDTIIDARAPAEFAEDHLPGAINLPVLDDEERAKVGTIYKQVSPFDARKIGGALVAKNVARHLEETLHDRQGGWRPLVYCWRGGQRSGSFATILAQVGWRVGLIDGGYKSYRRIIVKSMHDEPIPHKFILIDGPTGTAKTDLLAHLKAAGAQVIDLEGIYAHRGSLLGAVSRPQPSQKMAEGDLAMQLAHLDPAKPVYVEAESSKIGNRLVPPSVWNAMCAAPRIRVNAGIPARAEYLTRAYADLIDDPEALIERMEPLRKLQSRDLVDHWIELAKVGAFSTLAAELMELHYDSRYEKSASRYDYTLLGEIDLGDRIDEAALTRAAEQCLGFSAG